MSGNRTLPVDVRRDAIAREGAVQRARSEDVLLVRDHLTGAAVRVGYVRTGWGDSTALDAVSTLEAHGCGRVVIDSGTRHQAVSEVFSSLVARMAEGDTLMVVDLHHICGNMTALLGTLVDLQERGILLETPAGFNGSDPVVAAIVLMLHEFVRRDADGGNSRRVARGIRSGRPRRLAGDDVARAQRLLEDGGLTAKEVAHEVGVSRATLYRSLKNNSPG